MVVYALPYAPGLVISYIILPNYFLIQCYILVYCIGISLAGIQGQTWFTLMFLIMFSLTIFCYMERLLPV